MSLLAALALGAGAGVMESTFGYYNQKNLARQQQANYQKNLKLSQKLNIEAQKKVIEQSTTALKNAGLSPVLAAGGNFSAPAASAPLGSSSAPPAHFDFASALAASKEADLLKSQEANLDSQTAVNTAQKEKIQAETDNIRSRTPYELELLGSQASNFNALVQKYGTEQLYLGQQYQRMLDEDSFASKEIRRYAEAKRDNSQGTERDFWAAFYADVSRQKMTIGALAAMRRFAEFYNDLDEFQKEAVGRELYRSITEMQLKDDGILEALAHMPESQAVKMLAEAGEAMANRDFRIAYRTELLPYQAELTETERANIINHDFTGAMKAGRYKDAAYMLLPDLLHIGGQVMLLRQFGKGSALPAGKPSSPSEAISGKKVDPKAGKTSDGKAPPKIDLRSDTAVKQSVAARLGMQRTNALYDEFLKSGYKDPHGNNNFSAWLYNVKKIGHK